MTAELQRAPVSLPSVATILAAIGLRWLSYPTVAGARPALEAVRWPALTPAAAN